MNVRSSCNISRAVPLLSEQLALVQARKVVDAKLASLRLQIVHFNLQ